MNFYKITNKGENHNDLQYKTGLNVDVLPWNPEGDCEPGGIYFSREDILAFVDYGPWIRRVTIPSDVEIYENPREPKKWKAHKVILGERKKIDVNVIKSLLEEGANVSVANDRILKWESEKGHLEMVKLLLDYGADVHSAKDYALRWASRKGHFETVRLLLEHGADIHADDDWALRWASGKGHLEIVKTLTKHGANIHAMGDWALKEAIRNGHTKVVDLLLKHGTTT